jgi:hypothetical protein
MEVDLSQGCMCSEYGKFRRFYLLTDRRTVENHDTATAQLCPSLWHAEKQTCPWLQLFYEDEGRKEEQIYSSPVHTVERTLSNLCVPSLVSFT